MSAYGALSRLSSSNLPATAWPHPRDPHATVILFHIDSATLPHASGLFEHLHAVFADEVDKGLTYPQEDMRDPDAFRAYFFAADVVIALVVAGKVHDGKFVTGPAPNPLLLSGGAASRSVPVTRQGADGIGHGGDDQGVEVDIDLETARANRSWDVSVVGFYYVKPNYPGRSSHICNAGFVVPPPHRGDGYGRVLARSYLYYAPRLGYEASVFNLVYVNNVASIRLWEKLGFTKAGLIPKAGRLKRTDGPGEEYVDAWMIYKSFR